MRRITIVGIVAILVLGVAAVAYAAGPGLVRQPGAQAVTAEHIDALNNCDVNRLMAQYPESVHIILPDGGKAIGRVEVLDLFTGFCSQPDLYWNDETGSWANAGGLNGLTFTENEQWTVGKTVNMEWTADACFLASPYVGADAYETHANLMAAQVTTFDGSKLVFNDGSTCP